MPTPAPPHPPISACLDFLPPKLYIIIHKKNPVFLTDPV